VRVAKLNRNLIRTVALFILLVGIGVAVGAVHVSDAATGGVILVDPGATYQVIRGWEAADNGGNEEVPEFLLYRDDLLDKAVNELGINRVRLVVVSGVEAKEDYWANYLSGQEPRDYWGLGKHQIENDNNDPNSIDWSGFKFSSLDYKIDNIVLPMKQLVEANGEKLYINLIYVDNDQSTFEHYNNPDEYAEFMLAVFIHMRDKYGFVPDSIEIILEPDNVSGPGWTGTQIGEVIVATGDRLKAEGFAVPAFSGPSTMQAARSLIYLDEMLQVPGVTQYLSELAYHRYDGRPSNTDLMNIGNRGSQLGIDTAMLEKIGADYQMLHNDLKLANISSWQQFVLGWPATPAQDTGGSYYLIDLSNTSNIKVNMASRTVFLRQYFKYIRSGAQRIGASSNDGHFDPLAFINTNGTYVVVVKSRNGGGDFSVAGLPGGTYGVSFTTGGQSTTLGDVNVSSGGVLNSSIPGDGVISIFGKSTGSTQPQPTATPVPSTPTPVPSTPTPVPSTPTPVPSTSTPTPVPTASATPVSGSSANLAIRDGVANLSETISVDIVLSDAPSGLAGYDIQVGIQDPSVAKITGVRFDSTFPLTSEIIAADGSTVRIIAADLGNPGSVASGDTNIRFATLRVQGLVEGTTSIRFNSMKIDDDSGNAVSVNLLPGSFEVLNIAPVVSAGSDATINEGDTFVRTGSINDPGDNAWSGTVDYGDNSGVQTLAISGNTFTLNHTYSKDGVYNVTVNISDDNSAFGSDTIQVEVLHVYPTIPGLSSPSQDMDGDGLAEDVNGNGRLDFDDIVKFFKHIASQAIQDNSPDFDFNGNGFVDMDDIVRLFMILVSKFG